MRSRYLEKLVCTLAWTACLACSAQQNPCTSRVLDNGIGLIAISEFSAATPKAVNEILGSFAALHLRGVIVDLRGSGHGGANAVREVASLFVGAKPILWIVHTTQGDQDKPEHGTGNALWQGSVVVLVDAKTASMGELLASALQTGKSATVVGQQTGGKGNIYMVRSQPDGAPAKTVVGSFLTAARAPIEGVGIKPDVTLETGLSEAAVLSKATESLNLRTDDAAQTRPSSPEEPGAGGRMEQAAP